jgi:hypothetical protein
MANGRSDDFATKDIRKTVVCYVGDLPTEFESENATVTEPDGTLATITLGRLYIFSDGTVWEATPDGLKRRDDLGSCIPCWRPAIRSIRRRSQNPVIRSRDTFKACADCGRLRCRKHWIASSTDSSGDAYRCLSCAVRYKVTRLRQCAFFRRA